MTETTDTQTKTAAAPVEAAAKRTRKASAAKTATAVAAPVVAEAPAKALAGQPKLRWTIEQDWGNGKTQFSQMGTRVYRIDQAEEGYVATLAIDGHTQPEVLATGSFARCYGACVARNRAEAVAAAA